MNKFLICGILVFILSYSIIPDVSSYIPPTKAFEKLFIGSNHVEAKSYLGGLNVTCTGVSCTLTNGTTRPSLSISTSVQVPQIVNNTALKNKSTSISTSNLYTTLASGVYRVSVFQEITTSGASGTLSTQIAWTDETGTTQGINPASNLSVTSVNTFTQGTAYLDVQSSTNITMQSTLSGITGSPVYNVFITVEKLS